jgi:hypothetical protein
LGFFHRIGRKQTDVSIGGAVRPNTTDHRQLASFIESSSL